MGLADQLTLARVAAVPLVVAFYVSDFEGHDRWATGLFIAAMTTDWFDGRVARSAAARRRSARCSTLSPTRFSC
jgi:phosphatidylglycerophosphate synthase